MPDPRALLAALVLATGAHATDSGPTGAEAAWLEHLVIQDCGSCHGLRFKGGLGSPLTPEALAHHDGPETLAHIILDGIPDTAMPPWRALLTEEQALWIARYLIDPDARDKE
ncbi:cytochrome c [Aquicoccus porphyridii]|uniref:Cytochrome c n=1 Tax=Aquicoccus porphyridii TaxID=1852029 RepID=A0A5A9YZG9_9RHOB|nr:cytochrome c [Aquicoccus porphyridii]KAA0910242.1 cytochrome c [Aquicoccus porphyridii]RAI54390.1 cytochrome c [Rhodobacteraceae bacterium AsT-22]